MVSHAGSSDLDSSARSHRPSCEVIVPNIPPEARLHSNMFRRNLTPG